jgi:hypothetical protein
MTENIHGSFVWIGGPMHEVPKGRPTIAHGFNRGLNAKRPHVPAGTKEAVKQPVFIFLPLQKVWHHRVRLVRWSRL